MATSYFEIFEVFLTFLGVFVEAYLEIQFRDMLTLENVVSAKTYKAILTLLAEGDGLCCEGFKLHFH